MAVSNQDWQLLSFSGIPSFPGMDTIRMPFVVHGEILANTDKVGVKGMDFGNSKMSLVYEVQKSRLTGTLNIPGMPLDGGMNFGGAAQVRMDGSGFYFAASGQVSNVPVIVPVTLKSGIMLGYYNSPDYQDAHDVLFMYTHHKTFPCSFKNNGFKGFLVMGEIPVPGIGDMKVDIDLGIASAGAGLDAYVDGYIFGNYESGILKLGAGASANVRAYAYASIPALTVSGEVHTRGSLDMDVGFDMGTKKLNLGYDFRLSSTLSVSGELDYGLGTLSAKVPLGFCFSLDGSVGMNPFTRVGPSPGFSLGSSGCSTVCNE
jgi:hypothetical protein